MLTNNYLWVIVNLADGTLSSSSSYRYLVETLFTVLKINRPFISYTPSFDALFHRVNCTLGSFLCPLWSSWIHFDLHSSYLDHLTHKAVWTVASPNSVLNVTKFLFFIEGHWIFTYTNQGAQLWAALLGLESWRFLISSCRLVVASGDMRTIIALLKGDMVSCASLALSTTLLPLCQGFMCWQRERVNSRATG